MARNSPSAIDYALSGTTLLAVAGTFSPFQRRLLASGQPPGSEFCRDRQARSDINKNLPVDCFPEDCSGKQMGSPVSARDLRAAVPPLWLVNCIRDDPAFGSTVSFAVKVFSSNRCNARATRDCKAVSFQGLDRLSSMAPTSIARYATSRRRVRRSTLSVPWSFRTKSR